MTAARWRLVYDDHCGFCRWSAARILRWDRWRRAGRLTPIGLSDPLTNDLLEGLTPEERAASWHLVSPAGEVLSAGAAVAPLLRLLPAGWTIAWLPAAAPRTTSRLYGFVARHRATFGALLGQERCEVVPGD